MPQDREGETRLLTYVKERAAAQPGQPVALVKADAVVGAGLRPDVAETALRWMSGDYLSHLAVTEQGELVYEFAPGLVRRDARGLGERLMRFAAPVGHALWRAFTVGFKIWIAATLVIYSVVFAVLAIGLSLASEDDGPSGLLLWFLPDWFPGANRDPDGPPRKRFHRSVFDFVFGPPEALPPPQDDRDLLAMIRARQGRITATDLALLRGLDYRRAEEEATRLLARYDGEPEVAEDGSLIYTFRELRRTALTAGTWATPGLALPEVTQPEAAVPSLAGAGHDTAGPHRAGPDAIAPDAVTPDMIEILRNGNERLIPLSPFGAAGSPFGAAGGLALRPARRPETDLVYPHQATPPLTGNSGGTNVAIAVINGFNLVASLTVGPWAALVLGLSGPLLVLLTVVPLIFSLLFFGLPLGRAVVGRVRQGRRRRRNARRALLLTIARRRGEPVRRDDLLRQASEELIHGALDEGDADLLNGKGDPRDLLARELERMLPALEGDIAMNEGADSLGGVRYEFPRVKAELTAVERARREAAPDERSPGEVIFSSAREGVGV